jgi:uncharacterized membrane-anchored protein
MGLPNDHPYRRELHDEVHARPPEALVAPLRISYLALLNDKSQRETEARPIHELAARFGHAPPRERANHFSADLGAFRVKWERHTEFTRYKFIVPGAGDNPFADPAISAVPADWITSLPGQTMVAAHAALVPAPTQPSDPDVLSQKLFGGNTLIGSTIADGNATAFTDFRIHGDNFSRLLVEDRGLTPRQAGRSVQRLLEIDTYRIMALLALPVARELTPFLARCERELSAITTALVGAGEMDEPDLLNRLTRLEAEIESRHSDNYNRFGAAAAYYDLVRRRIDELRETRVTGLQTFQEFTERRLAPAMNTCRAVGERQEALSKRVAQTTQLLSTRVDVAREQQNQKVLEQMNRRARMQLRLQETVEGLSVAAVTYYVVGLVGYAAKGLKASGRDINPDVWTGVSIPIVAVLVALGLSKFRRMLGGFTKTKRSNQPAG